MAISPLSRVIEHLRRDSLFPEHSRQNDTELLEAFLVRREEAAFEALVRRHGPMILGVCRRILLDRHSAEDAFQATFMVFIQKASSISKLIYCPSAAGVALDFSSLMLERLRERFGSDNRVRVVEHDLDRLLPEMGMFHVVASSFAIHHLTHDRKRELYTEIWNRLQPGGVFCNLEHVASPSHRVHERFLDTLGIAAEEEDPSNKLLDVETQLRWLREIGFQDVDCFWKWRELALLVGKKAG